MTKPIETALKQNGSEMLLWHGRWNVGGWFDSWPYDQRHPDAVNGAWVINGGHVVNPTHWDILPLPPQPKTE